MNKTDWLQLFLKALGLYLIATPLPALVSTSFSLVMVLSQGGNSQISASQLFLWQGPIVAVVSILIGLVLIYQSKALAAWALGVDETA